MNDSNPSTTGEGVSLPRRAKRGLLAGFTLVEILVALAVTTLLLVLLASFSLSGMNLSALIHGRLSNHQSGKAVLDFFERDFVGLTMAEPGRTTLTIVADPVDGPNGSSVSSFWIMLLSRPVNEGGALRALSYRLVYNDPMTPGGASNRLALYRTQLTPTGAVSAVLDVGDLHAGFWEDYWATYAADDGGRTLLDDYLVENVVDIQVTVNYRYLNDQGDTDPANDVWEVVSVPATDTINWTSNGFEGASIDDTPNTPVSITLTLTFLLPEGVALYEAGVMQLDDAMQKQGFVLSRTFPMLTSLGN